MTKGTTELLLACRQWMQTALEELTVCPTSHSGAISLLAGERLLDEVDAALRGAIRSAPREDAQHQRLLEVEGAVAALGGAFVSLDALVAAAKAVEGTRR